MTVVEDFEHVVLSPAFDPDDVIGEVWDTIDHCEFGDRVDGASMTPFRPRVILYPDEGP